MPLDGGTPGIRRSLLALTSTSRLRHLQRLLEATGQEVELVHAESLGDALAFFDYGSVHAALLDAELSRDPLLADLSRLRERSPDLPVLVLSTPGGGPAAERAGAEGSVCIDTVEAAPLWSAIEAAIERGAHSAHFRDSRHVLGELAGGIHLCATCRASRTREGYWRALEGWAEEDGRPRLSLVGCPRCHGEASRPWPRSA